MIASQSSNLQSNSLNSQRSKLFGNWFNKFTTTNSSKCQAIKKPKHTIFGIELDTLLNMTGTTVPLLTEPYILVHLPQLVNCCSNHILTYGSQEVGIFRINGNNKRMELLQQEFSKDPKLSSIDFEKFTNHDVAGVLTRFLSNLPNPLIPPAYYDPLRFAWIYLEKEDDIKEAFIDCLSRLPYQNRHLLMYILNFLNLLSLNEEYTQMGISNLSSIFQPSILSHPQHLLQPKEYLISQKVVEFMIAHNLEFLKILSTEFDLTNSPSRSSLANSTINLKKLSSKRKCRNFAPEFSPTANNRRSLSFSSRLSKVSILGGGGCDRSSSSFSILSESSNSSALTSRLNSIRGALMRPQSLISTTNSCPPVNNQQSSCKRSSNKLNSIGIGNIWDHLNNRLSLIN